MRRKRRENNKVEEAQFTPSAPEARGTKGNSIRPAAHLYD